MTVRATRRGAERTSLDGTRADVLVCGASFAGLAIARELADLVAVDDEHVGAIRQELPAMTFSTPHGTVRFRLPWSWAAFDYAALCAALWALASQPLCDRAFGWYLDQAHPAYARAS